MPVLIGLRVVVVVLVVAGVVVVEEVDCVVL